MARRKLGAFGKPKIQRTEPREFADPAAAPEPLTAVREQARVDDNETGNRGQSDDAATSGGSRRSRRRAGAGKRKPPGTRTPLRNLKGSDDAAPSEERPRPKPWRKRTQEGSRKRRGPRTVLSDSQWNVARKHVYGERGKSGRNAKHNRMKLEGMLWIFRTGAPWRDLPEDYGHWLNVYQTFRRWAKNGVFLLLFLSLAQDNDLRIVMVDGTFLKVHRHATGAPKNGASSEESRVNQAIGASRGGLNTKLIAVTDSRGRLLTFLLVPGNADEGSRLATLLDQLDTEQVDELLGDKAFDNDIIRNMLRGKMIKDTIPWKKGRKNPRPYDKWAYKGRHLIENIFADLKVFRGVATRYHKLVTAFCAGLHLVYWHMRTRGRKLRSSKFLES